MKLFVTLNELHWRTNIIKGFFKNHQRSGEPHDQQRLSSEEAEEDALHGRGHDELGDADQTIRLFS